VIYVLQPERGGPVKIGHTAASDPNGRLSTCQTGNHERLRVVDTFEGTMRDERDLHTRFAKARLHGEWFKVTPEIRAWLEGRIRVTVRRQERDRPIAARARRPLPRRDPARTRYQRVLDAVQRIGRPARAAAIRELAPVDALPATLRVLYDRGWIARYVSRGEDYFMEWGPMPGLDEQVSLVHLDLSPDAIRILAACASDLPVEDAAAFRLATERVGARPR
jgi:hypothetical protein